MPSTDTEMKLSTARSQTKDNLVISTGDDLSGLEWTDKDESDFVEAMKKVNKIRSNTHEETKWQHQK